MRLLPAVVVLLLGPLGGLRAGEQGKTAQRPNIVLILADDMGYADIGPQGCQDIPTPHIDRIAARGVRFTDAYANGSFCTPTRAALLSGQVPAARRLRGPVPTVASRGGDPASSGSKRPVTSPAWSGSGTSARRPA